MASPFDRLMDTIRPHLPGAVDNAIRQELFPVCEEFFDKSNVWTEDIPFTVNLNDTEASIIPFSGRISKLMYVLNANSQPVGGITMSDTQQGTLEFPYALTPGSYVATVAITVSDPISRDAFPIVPVDIITKHWRTLMYGILANMMVMPAKPFTNVQLAAYYKGKYVGGAGRAANAQKTGNTFGSQNWRFPQSFNRKRVNGR